MSEKISWHADHPEIQKEGAVYGELHEAEVRNVAKMPVAWGRARDVRVTIDDSRGRASAGVQQTRARDHLNHPSCTVTWDGTFPWTIYPTESTFKFSDGYLGAL